MFLFRRLFVLILAIINPTNGTQTYLIDVQGVGRIFDGVGAISGGGATSKLLINYPEKQRKEILDYLFKPGYGASLHILKVEIGGDAQSTEGTELSHMHNSWDENYHRGYEWWLMKEAKKRNPEIKLYGLPWGFPGWVGGGHRLWPFEKPERVADYVIKWISGAQRVHQLKIDYIGLWNEKPYDTTYIKVLRKMLNERGFSHVEIVAADAPGINGYDVVKDIAKDPEVNKSIAILGSHYTDTITTLDARSSGKPLWSSEDFAWTNNEAGAGCLARLLNQNYVNGLMTSTIAWNLVASYYDNLPVGRRGLMEANEPWSGHYEVSPPIWAMAHTSHFVKPGWRYLNHDAGVSFLDDGGSFVTFVSPAKDHITIVIETMDTEQADFCVRFHPRRAVAPVSTARFDLRNFKKEAMSFSLFRTTLGLGMKPSVFLQKETPLKVDLVEGSISLSLLANSIYTLTTLPTDDQVNLYEEAKTRPVPLSKAFPLPYKDNFEGYNVGREAFNFEQQVGAFEVHADTDKVKNKVLRQVALETPVHWCPTLLSQPMIVIGNYNWSEISVQVDARIPLVNGSSGFFVAARVDQGGCETFMAKGLFLYLLASEQRVVITGDLARAMQLYSAPFKVRQGQWYTLKLKVSSSYVTAQIDSNPIFNGKLDISSKNGFTAVGSEGFGLTEFDNFYLK